MFVLTYQTFNNINLIRIIKITFIEKKINLGKWSVIDLVLNGDICDTFGHLIQTDMIRKRRSRTGRVYSGGDTSRNSILLKITKTLKNLFTFEVDWCEGRRPTAPPEWLRLLVLTQESWTALNSVHKGQLWSTVIPLKYWCLYECDFEWIRNSNVVT